MNSPRTPKRRRDDGSFKATTSSSSPQKTRRLNNGTPKSTKHARDASLEGLLPYDMQGSFDSSTDYIERLKLDTSSFYPPEMSNERAKAYINGQIMSPMQKLEWALTESRQDRAECSPGDAIVHWFRSDLRIDDNTALHHASNLADRIGKPLITVFLYSHEDYEAHLTSPARIDFVLRTLEILRRDLRALNIPLWVEEVQKRDQVPQKILAFCRRWQAGRLFINLEYEVDELRRDTRCLREGLGQDIAVEVYHDNCVVKPGNLPMQIGGKTKGVVYASWFRNWISYLHQHKEVFEPWPLPKPNSAQVWDEHFAQLPEYIPVPRDVKLLPPRDQARLARIWPAGEHEGMRRLQTFIARIEEYAITRNTPSMLGGTSALSVHLSAGTLSMRRVVKAAVMANVEARTDPPKINDPLQSPEARVLHEQTSSLSSLNEPTTPTRREGDEKLPWFASAEDETTFATKFISECAWRDFYRHALVKWPHTCMGKPFKLEFLDIQWEDNEEHFRAWCQGRTGYPIVDAAMRQLNAMKYMHNRTRLVVARLPPSFLMYRFITDYFSFLTKHLMIDWRKGERYFMSQLIDGDFASNNGGWGFGNGGLDSQPFLRLFNPILQSEKFDPEGDYIRTWIPELKDVPSPAIHDPVKRLPGPEFKKLGYSEHIIEHEFARARCLERYRIVYPPGG